MCGLLPLLGRLESDLNLSAKFLWIGDVLEGLVRAPGTDNVDSAVIQDHAEDGLDYPDTLNLCELDLEGAALDDAMLGNDPLVSKREFCGRSDERSSDGADSGHEDEERRSEANVPAEEGVLACEGEDGGDNTNQEPRKWIEEDAPMWSSSV